MGGSLGMAAGEAVIRGIHTAVQKHTPFIFFAASGGARMQEGILALMQMPRTTIAVQTLRAARLPYIVVLTNPTTGGVTASYAMLGDIHIAEPGALIGFAGPARHRADNKGKVAGRLSEGGIPAGARHDRYGRAPSPIARYHRAALSHSGQDGGAESTREQSTPGIGRRAPSRAVRRRRKWRSRIVLACAGVEECSAARLPHIAGSSVGARSIVPYAVEVD